MPILLKRKNGEITPFRNAEYISAFYFIPKSILDKCGEEINSIPRNPRKLLQDRRAIEIIESDLFKLVIIDAYAFMVWPFMGLGAKREIYSGYEPSWRYAHAASIWIKGMEDEGVIPKSHEILKSSNVDEDLGYISEEEISETFTWLVPKIMAKHNMNEIIAVAAEYRCFEDFDYRKSRQKIDFYRKWYHTRAKISVESLDEIKEKYAENTDGMEWDIPDDSVNDRIAGWMAMKEYFSPKKNEFGELEPQLKVFKTCFNLNRTIPMLRHDERKVNDVATDPHEITHAPDALRCFCLN